MIRVGLVGFGLAGRVFHAPLLSSVDGFELVSVVERTTHEAETRYPGIQTVRSFDELIADRLHNLIVVATPGSTHFDFARRALECGKHVVVDKPMALHSTEIAQIAALAATRGCLAVPFQSRRWDSDFLTLSQVMQEGSLGRIVSLESRMDRWSPGRTRKPWKNIPEEGGILLDLGTHLVDQALVLFGKPLGVSAEVDRERDGDGSNDAFTIRLRYAGHRVTLGSNVLSSIPGFRYSLRGTKGSFRKHGIDPQEAALGKITHIASPTWGQEPMHDWGVRHIDLDGGIDTESVESIPGDYRQFYIRLREAILHGAPPPAMATEAWRTARVLEWAVQSSAERREIECDFSKEPML
ncbi:Gfo/Idh/MocA family oxidoreductase [Terracidiphilus sp.]|jgi:scyllo-inositol 2-dehydrogenase (NADP+)|uniref:Gfo/Idh/MocA family oxidoreductase n=1 Tax=Terracidiphilus sp. TaxID=1964191 RepID=UPI003C26FD8E